MYSEKTSKSMTTRHQLELGSATLFAIAASIGVFLAVYNNNHFKTTTYALPSTSSLDKPIVTPFFAPKEESFSQISPDGAKKVLLSVVENQESGKKYTLTTADGDSTNQVEVYSTTFPDTENVSIPFNSFSPDNKYFFVIHQKGGINEAMVFRVDGEKMTETEQFVEVAKTFAEKTIKDPYKETTGWASEALLIVNTTPENKSKQSYWFEVPSKGIIGLSTEFYD